MLDLLSPISFFNVGSDHKRASVFFTEVALVSGCENDIFWS
jgi:hypothetical protein